MRFVWRIALVTALLLSWAGAGIQPSVCRAQSIPSDEEKERPRIGLVLSGGGARGAAHVGILEVLEELRVPVDYIAGASMGAIVGGLYASGLSPQDIEVAFAKVDWENAFHDAPDRQNISFRRKEDDNQALFPFELGVGKRGI
jgi:NTE family protein